MKHCVCLPLYNGGMLFVESLRLLLLQMPAEDVYIIDSSSSDGSSSKAMESGVNFFSIPKAQFNHGGTRNLFIETFALGEKYDVVIYLTQDALLEPFAIETVLKLFELNQTAGIVYGRQIPHVDANPLAAHARIYNYPDKDCFKDKSKIREYGIKTVFISNSFAAYRIEALKRVNYFPIHTILCEDMFVASKVIELGGSIIYSSKAIVRHSHNYTIFQEFSRYFDIGVFHSKESWIRKEFGGAGSEGVKYLISELKYLLANGNYCWIVVSILANFFKLMGMFIGKRYALLSDSLIKKLSMHKGYWEF